MNSFVQWILNSDSLVLSFYRSHKMRNILCVEAKRRVAALTLVQAGNICDMPSFHQSDVLHFLCEQSVDKVVVQIAHINFMQIMPNFIRHMGQV